MSRQKIGKCQYWGEIMKGNADDGRKVSEKVPNGGTVVIFTLESLEWEMS